MATSSRRKPVHGQSGKLRIGDDWNAINIIALSQSNPLKAVAELVENSIDAHAEHVTIIRGRSRGQSYLKVIDDGDGVPLDADGRPNFKYVATHICDSIKRQMKAQGQQGIQGEFGIGLLSFWTVGQSLALVSPGSDGKAYEMRMEKGAPSYSILPIRRLLADGGTELTIQPLLPGIRHFSGEKLQWYLASELRDRIRQSGVEIRIIDRQARAEYRVEPRAFTGQLLHHLPVLATE
jgi:DNA gyrase/topoisomerase IV subunit B